MQARVILAGALAATIGVTPACGSGDDSAIPGDDGGAGADTDASATGIDAAGGVGNDSGGNHGDAGGESGGPVDAGTLNGCTPGPGGNFVDKTAGAGSRQFNFATAAQYTIAAAPGKPPCMLINKGQAVKWIGQGGATFKTVPLSPAGGTTPNPITAQNGGIATYQATFPNAGVYGFNNPSQPTVMFGAVEVQ
jgi:hypothetical protein